jgi:hypothetical protein
MFRFRALSMEDYPILGIVLFLMGTILVALAYYSPNALLPFFEDVHGDAMSSLVLGHIVAFNGVFLVVLGCRKLDRARGRPRVS